MTRNSQAALAIVVGTLGGFVTMALHPTGADTMQRAGEGASNWLVRGVHLLAILMQPLLVAGLLGFTLRLRARAELAVTAFVFFVLASGAILVAAAASGLMAPHFAGNAATLSGSVRDVALSQFYYTGVLNQTFAAVYVLLAGVAVMLWSLAMRATPEFSRTLSWLGLVVGAAEVGGILSGHLHLSIHGFGAVVLAQGAWLLGVAAVMRRDHA